MPDNSDEFLASRPARVIGEGPWKGKRGIIRQVDRERRVVVLCFEHFDRVIPCELEYESVENIPLGEWDPDLEHVLMSLHRLCGPNWWVS